MCGEVFCILIGHLVFQIATLYIASWHSLQSYNLSEIVSSAGGVPIERPTLTIEVTVAVWRTIQGLRTIDNMWLTTIVKVLCVYCRHCLWTMLFFVSVTVIVRRTITVLCHDAEHCQNDNVCPLYRFIDIVQGTMSISFCIGSISYFVAALSAGQCSQTDCPSCISIAVFVRSKISSNRRILRKHLSSLLFQQIISNPPVIPIANPGLDPE